MSVASHRAAYAADEAKPCRTMCLQDPSMLKRGQRPCYELSLEAASWSLRPKSFVEEVEEAKVRVDSIRRGSLAAEDVANCRIAVISAERKSSRVLIVD